MKQFNTMKKYFAVGVTALMLVVSCSDDFLEVAPTGSLADAQVGTKAGIEGLLIGTCQLRSAQAPCRVRLP